MEQQDSAPPETIALVNFLRNKATLHPHVGILNGKRVEYFKGKHAVEALTSPAYQALVKKGKVPAAETKEAATQLLHDTIRFAFFLRVDRGDKIKARDANGAAAASGGRMIRINPMQTFQPDLYFVWLFEGSQLYLKLAGFGMVAVILAAVMFPLWPAFMRQGVWYLSILVLFLIGALVALSIIRLIFYIITIIVASPGIWLFPNLFADVGFIDSFKPVWAWDVPPPPKKKRSKAEEEDTAAVEGAPSEKAQASETAPSGRKAVANLPGVSQAEPQLRGANIAKAATPKPAAKAQQKEYTKLDELD